MKNKKREIHKHHEKEPILEREVSTSNGKYSCEIIKDEDRIFSRYALDVNKPKGVLYCCVKHNGKLEKFLKLNSRQEELTYLSFEGTDILHSNYRVDSEVKNIDYDATNNQFIVKFHHLITFGDGLKVPLHERSVQIPVPETIYNKIKKLFKR